MINSHQRDSIVIIRLYRGHYRDVSIFIRLYLTSQKKNSLHKRALKITYNDTSSIQELLHKENSASFFIF